MGIWSRFDSWVNQVTGLGTSRDKAAFTQYERQGRLDDETAQSLLDEDDLAATICETVPEQMMREGFKVVIPDDKEAEKRTNKAIEKCGFIEQLTNALVWERGFGGSAVILGCDDGQDMSEPLDNTRLRRILYCNAMDRRDLVPQYWYDDPEAEKYGVPEVYRCNFFFAGLHRPNGDAPIRTRLVNIHESRMLVFRGTRTTIRGRLRMHGWGNSVLSRVAPALATFNSNWQSVRNIMTDASQGVFKIKDLISLLASDNQATLLERLAMLDRGRSVARAIIVDADNEDFERRDTTLSGLPDLIDRSATRLASAARMPVTVLLGISPAGLNATGESDIRNWYDQLKTQRTLKVDPAVYQFVRLLFLAKEGPTNGVEPENWSIEWPALWQQTETEKTQNSATQTTSDVALVQAGVLQPEEVAIRRAKELGIDPKEREETLAQYKAKLNEPDTETDNPTADPTEETVGTTTTANPSGVAVPTKVPSRSEQALNSTGKSPVEPDKG